MIDVWWRATESTWIRLLFRLRLRSYSSRRKGRSIQATKFTTANRCYTLIKKPEFIFLVIFLDWARLCYPRTQWTQITGLEHQTSYSGAQMACNGSESNVLAPNDLNPNRRKMAASRNLSASFTSRRLSPQWAKRFECGKMSWRELENFSFSVLVVPLKSVFLMIKELIQDFKGKLVLEKDSGSFS